MGDQTKPTQGQRQDNGEEWDTDLETDDITNKRPGSSLEELYLQACKQTGATPVSAFFRHLGEASLNLNHYGVGTLGAKALAIVLKNDYIKTNLELQDNALQAQGTRYVTEMLQTNTRIQSLNLSNNHLRLEGANIISKMLHDNCYIRSLKLSGNDFDDSAAESFADALKGDYVVQVLDLSHNKFCDTEHLGYMLATNLGIEVLDLSWNHIRMGGAVALSAGLKANSTLKELLLSWNGFGPVEAQALGQALKVNSTLVRLDLSSNRLDDQAVTLLCPSLASNDTLRVLKLSHNPMTDTGALTLLKTVENTKSALEEIDISTVFVCEAFVELLEEARQSRPALDVQYSVMSSVTRNLSALSIFQVKRQHLMVDILSTLTIIKIVLSLLECFHKVLKERNESIIDFFQALDKEGTMKISTAAFREAVKAANIPLDEQQLDWMTRNFDKCTATISYSQFAQLS